MLFASDLWWRESRLASPSSEYTKLVSNKHENYYFKQVNITAKEPR